MCVYVCFELLFILVWDFVRDSVGIWGHLLWATPVVIFRFIFMSDYVSVVLPALLGVPAKELAVLEELTSFFKNSELSSAFIVKFSDSKVSCSSKLSADTLKGSSLVRDI